MHNPFWSEVLHALGDTVRPFEEEPRVEASRAEAAQVVLELTSVPNQKVLKQTKKILSIYFKPQQVCRAYYI